MAKHPAGLDPAPKKKRNPQDATRKHDVDPVRRRVEVLERRMKALEAWASTLVNEDRPPVSFVKDGND